MKKGNISNISLIASLTLALFFIVGNISASKLDSSDIKSLARELKNKEIYPGIFLVPDINTPLRKMKNGSIAELDKNYRVAVIEHNILKLYPMHNSGNSFDSIIFIQVPMGISEGSEKKELFFSYPGTIWFLLLRKCITMDKKTKYWMKDIGNGNSPELFNTNSVYDINDPEKWNYSLSWNDKYPVPGASQPMDIELAKDILNASNYMRTLPDGAKVDINSLSRMMKTPLGKYMAMLLAK